MLGEAKGTLKEDVTSISEQEKARLINLSLTAANDVKNKKGNSRKTKKTTVELAEIGDVTYQLIATNKEKNQSRATTEDKIRSIGLVNSVTSTLIRKFQEGKISSNHVRDITKITNLDNITQLAPGTQDKLTEIIIENRNIQNDINSSEAAILLIKSGKSDKSTVDTWYRGVLRLIQKLSHYADVDDETASNLSLEQFSHLTANLKILISRLNALLLLLEKYSKYD